MNGRPRPSETDLQLYLARALPISKRLMMAWALRVDRELRAELRRLEEGNASFRKKEMRRLQGILFPAPPGSGARTHAARGFSVRRGWGPALACAMGMVVLCVLPYRAGTGGSGASGSAAFSHAFSDEAGFGEGIASGPGFIAKGRALGVNLFVKGDSAYRVERQTALVAVTDTLQVMPLGSEAQHLVLLGWDARQGLVRLFPKDGERARKVSGQDPPPALLLQDMTDNRLICVTAVGPFRIADAEAALRRKPFLPMEKAPASHLQNGLYMQVFSITKGGGRI
jgi:hypothetical protein